MSDIDPKPDNVEIPQNQDWEEMTSFQRWYYKNKEEHIENVSEYKNDKINFVAKQRLDWVCSECGETHPATLQFHHTDENKYDMRLRSMASEGYSKETIKSEIGAGEILCSNCHRIRHYENGDHPWDEFKQRMNLVNQKLK